MCDVALDPYTSHGHDGILKSNYVDNDETVEVLVKQALLQAQMGCDVIAPSDMMDGRVGKIRKVLDKNGNESVSPIYSLGARSKGIGSAPTLEMAQRAFGSLAFKNGNVDVDTWPDEDRKKYIKKAHYNLFKLHAKDVIIDLLKL